VSKDSLNNLSFLPEVLMSLLIKNAAILTMESDEPEFLEANLGIQKNRIAFVGDTPDNFKVVT